MQWAISVHRREERGREQVLRREVKSASIQREHRLCVCTYIYIYTHMDIWIFHRCMHACMHARMYVYVCVCVYVYVYVYVYVCVCVRV